MRLVYAKDMEALNSIERWDDFVSERYDPIMWIARKLAGKK